MIHISEERICDLDYGVRPDISDAVYQEAARVAVRSLLEDKFENFKLRDVFLIIYPHIQDQRGFTPYKLFRALSKKEKEKIKSGSALANYLERLVKMELIEQLPDVQATYRLSRVAELEFRRIFQVLLGRHFIESLKSYYSQIYALSCVIARGLKEEYPNDRDLEVFDLTRVLIETGVRVACNDVLYKRVLVRPCVRCFYPVRRESFTLEQDLLDEVIEQDISVKERIRRFIHLMDQGKGVASGAILAYFQQFSFPRKAIEEGIARLYRMGELYRTQEGDYKVRRLREIGG